MLKEKQQLQTGIRELGLFISEEVQNRMLSFLKLLQKWNNAYNLTAIDTISEMVVYHLLDSLTITPYVIGARVLDVGTGAGFPGIPLAFTCPKKFFVLLDSNGKKIRFLRQVKSEFHLNNIDIIQSRMESFYTHDCFDVIISRAVGALRKIITQSQHLCCKNGRWLIMKGAYLKEELKQIQQPARIVQLHVPGLMMKRHLVVITQDD